MFSTKNSLRTKIRAQLDEFFCDMLKTQWSVARMTDLFLSSSLYKDAQTVLAYAATCHELSVDSIISSALRDGKHVALPKTNPNVQEMEFHYLMNDIPLENQLQPGSYGIREPNTSLPVVDSARFPVRTAILVPGIAFTASGDRMGHGKGYYDRYLSKVLQLNHTIHLPTSLIGFCLDFQVLEDIPVAEHDIAITHIVTPSGIYECGC